MEIVGGAEQSVQPLSRYSYRSYESSVVPSAPFSDCLFDDVILNLFQDLRLRTNR